MIRWAVAYAERLSWPVFPLHRIRPDGRCSCLDPRCGSPGKHPRTPHGVKDATTDLGTIREWWTRWPDANIGAAGGRAWWALDVDGLPGRESLDRLVRAHGPMPSTVEQETGSGGMHLLFLPDHRVRNRVKFAPGLDTRGDAGYIVLAPSNHASGRRYRWRVPPGDHAMARAPEWLTLIVSPPAPTPAVAPPMPRIEDRDLVVRRARAWLNRVPPAISGQAGHDRTMRAALGLVRGFALEPSVALALLSDWNLACEPPWSRRELEHKIASALKSNRVGMGYLLDGRAA